MSDKNTGTSLVQEKESDSHDDDPVIAKLKKTGCLEKHYAVLVIYPFVLSFHKVISDWLYYIYRNVWLKPMIGENVKRNSKPLESAS